MANATSLLERSRSMNPRLGDAALASGLTLWALADLQHPPDRALKAVVMVMTVALVWRRRWPLGVLAVAFGCLLAVNDADGGVPELAAVIIAIYSAALYSRHRAIVFITVASAASFAAAAGGGLPVAGEVLPFVVAGPVWLAGSALRRRELRVDAWADRADRLEREQQVTLAAERARIARELHDVVTHGVSVMVLQTGAARQILDVDGSRAAELLRSVESEGRAALDELRHLLGLLSSDEAAPLAPQPGVEQLPELVARVREAGLPVDLAVEGAVRTLPAGLDLTAYRIIQEALTNALKHARRAPTQVIIRYAHAALELDVIDAGPTVADDRCPSGRGIVGMRQRVAIYGGTVAAEPQAPHGYAVRARLPLAPASE